MDKQHAIVKGSLSAFVTSHISGADLSVVDECVLAYVVSILEEASDDPCFDVDGFIEMMSAYIPEFSGIDPATICSWIFQLESELSALNQADTQTERSGADALRSLSLSAMLPEPVAPVPVTAATQATPANGNGGGGGGGNNHKRTQHLSETSDGGSTDSSTSCCADFYTDECDLLQEMFPDSSYLEVKHCVGIANGDVDRATQMLLDRQDAGQSLMANPASLHAPKSQVIDEKELKSRIITRWVR